MGVKGVGGSKKGRKLSDLTRERMSRLHTGSTLTPEHSRNISRALKGRLRTPEHRAAISKSKKGKKLGPPSPESRAMRRGWYTPNEVGDRCEICNRPFEKLFQDHDHKTGKSRGKLCPHCNLMLGYAGDVVQVLESAIVYLKKYHTTSGVIAPDGALVPIEDREPVKPGTVAADLSWLRSVVRWACAWRDEHGKVLMERDSTAGLELPVDKNIARPVATTDRYRKLREHSDKVTMEILEGGKKVQVRTYLTELLDLAFHTGRRIGAILGIQYADLHLNAGPHGAVTWRADTDKMGKAWTAPINKDARAAIDRVLADRPGIGAAYLFPSPRNPEQAVSKDLASAWLEKCERLAELPHLKQGLWHPFRRSWATARKGLPVQDVMAVGGWTDPSCLTTIYQQPDVDTMVRVANEAAEVREVSHG